MASDTFDEHLAGLATLGEPIRRLLYRYVVSQAHSVSREEAANGVGVPWHIAKFHLDRLEQNGLLDVEFSRPPGRTGPGAGRPTKLYRRSDRELRVSLPERRYDLASLIMARAITAVQAGNTSMADALREAAANIGRSLGEEARRRLGPYGDEETLLAAARTIIDEQGYESRSDGERITLANCPFHALAQEYRELICGMNLDLFRGLIEGLHLTQAEARLDPASGRCCVTVGIP